MSTRQTMIRFFAVLIFTLAISSFVFAQDTTLTVTSDGKVGIGTTTPGEKLEIRHGVGYGFEGLRIFRPAGVAGIIPFMSGEVGTSTSGFQINIDTGLPAFANLLLQTNGTTRLYIDDGGKVGIGTTDPKYGLLQLKTTESMDGGLTLYRGTGNTARSWINSNDVWLMHRGGTTTRGIAIDASGKVGIGTRIPSAALDIVPDANKNLLEFSTGRPWVFKEIGSGGESRLALQSTVNGKWFEIRDINGGTTAHFYTHQDSRYDRVWLVPDGGSVGIGTRSPNSTLAVNGTITCKEVEVTLSGWSDFVFADNYELMPLEEVEKHIKLNKRLPDIPSEKEVLENGLNLGKMQSKLLQKIEELTLYVIDIKKENAELRQRLSSLEK